MAEYNALKLVNNCLLLDLGRVKGHVDLSSLAGDGSGGGAAVWGGITGTLSAQTDLQSALNAKANTSALSAYLPLTGGTLTGNLSFGNSTSTSTATPLRINLGGTYSNTNGANPKLIIGDIGGGIYGIGVDPSSLMSFQVLAGAGYGWYINGSLTEKIFSDGNHAIGSASNTGEKFQVTGTSKFTGAVNITSNLILGAGADIFFGGYSAIRSGSTHIYGGGASGLELTHQIGSTSLFKTYSTGQIAMGGGSTITTPSTSSILDLQSTNKGFLPPRMTTAQKNAISSPATGLVLFDTDLGKLCVFSTTWQTLTSV